MSAADAGVGLYVHFPWCVRKCPYCDFNSHPLKGSLDEPGYLQALLTDFANQQPALSGRRIDTVFFGGGTPSLFSPASFEVLLDAIAANLSAGAEITMEANPGTTEHRDLGGYRQAGINRLSLGAQTFDTASLEALGRIHSSDDITRSFDAARRAGFDNINLDLMYGLPGQNRNAALADVNTAIALQPEHLSWYQLTIEPKTEFARRPPPLPTDLMLESVEQAGYELLEAGGYQRYEVSAFSRTNQQCRHNLNYWSFGDYLGIGAGAHGKLSDGQGAVRTSVRTRKAHQPRVFLKQPDHTMRETIASEALAGEFMMNALRLTDGIALAVFETSTGLNLDVLEPHRSRQIDNGLLRANRLAATARGYALLDSVIQDYL